MGLWATWSSGRCPCPWQGGWSEMIFKVPSNPAHSVILWFYDWLLPPLSCRLLLHSTTGPPYPCHSSFACFRKGTKLVKVAQRSIHVAICRLGPKCIDLWQRTWADLGHIHPRLSSWMSFVPLKIFPKSLLLMSSAFHITSAWLKTWLKILYWQTTIWQQIWCIFMSTHWKGKPVFNKVSLVPNCRWHFAFQLIISKMIWLKIYLFHTSIHVLCAYERALKENRTFYFAGT